MRLAIMQPYFFPYIGYWQLIRSVDRFVIYDDVNYIVRGWINRNRILINNEPRYITLPLQHASQNRRINDIFLLPSQDLRPKLIKSVEQAYRKATCFAEVFPIIESAIRHEADNLSEYLAHQLHTLSVFLGIDTQFVVSSRIYSNRDLSGQERILDICRREGATTYVNLQGGRALYGQEAFVRNNVELEFLIPSSIEYTQFGAPFSPWLSIIDVMMFNGLAGTKILLEKYSIEASTR